MTPQKPLPTWILIISGVLALLEILVSIELCISPESVFESADLNATGVHYLFYMWASRQFALGVIGTVATFKRSAPMLTITYIFFFVMFLGDLLIGVSQKDNALIISALVMCGVAAAMIFFINRKR